jgi:cobaltochelatase CobN
MQKANLDQDIAEMMRFVNHGDHQHEWDGSYTDDGTPLTLAEMNATDFSHLLEDIDGYLCELGSLQIRDGLHTLGYIPTGEQLCGLLRALTRIPNGEIPSLRAEIAAWLGFDLEELLANRGKRFTIYDLRFTIGELSRVYVTHADVIELIDELSLRLLQHLEAANFASSEIEAAISTILGHPQSNHPQPSGTTDQGEAPPWGALRPTQNTPQSKIQNRKSKNVNVLSFICDTLVPLIRRNDEEISN